MHTFDVVADLYLSTGSEEEDWASSGGEGTSKRTPRKLTKFPMPPLVSEFLNLSTDELPPIGFFWDIENCQVCAAEKSDKHYYNVCKYFSNYHVYV